MASTRRRAKTEETKTEDSAAAAVETVTGTPETAAGAGVNTNPTPFAAPVVQGYSPAGAVLPDMSLQTIVACTQAEGFCYTLNSPDQAQMVAAGLVELNAAQQGPEGFTATRATQAGINSIMEQNQANAAAGAVESNTATQAAAKPQASFEIETIDSLPASVRTSNGNAGRTEKYPFGQLAAPSEVNGKPQYASFFIPGKTSTQIASTISGANARFAVDTGKKRMTRASAKHAAREVPELEFTRVFEARNEKHPTKGDGVRVVRTK